jgi:hypothetical protein
VLLVPCKRQELFFGLRSRIDGVVAENRCRIALGIDGHVNQRGREVNRRLAA